MWAVNELAKELTKDALDALVAATEAIAAATDAPVANVYSPLASASPPVTRYFCGDLSSSAGAGAGAGGNSSTSPPACSAAARGAAPGAGGNSSSPPACAGFAPFADGAAGWFVLLGLIAPSGFSAFPPAVSAACCSICACGGGYPCKGRFPMDSRCGPGIDFSPPGFAVKGVCCPAIPLLALAVRLLPPDP